MRDGFVGNAGGGGVPKEGEGISIREVVNCLHKIIIVFMNFALGYKSSDGIVLKLSLTSTNSNLKPNPSFISTPNQTPNPTPMPNSLSLATLTM